MHFFSSKPLFNHCSLHLETVSIWDYLVDWHVLRDFLQQLKFLLLFLPPFNSVIKENAIFLSLVSLYISTGSFSKVFHQKQIIERYKSVIKTKVLFD